MEAHADLSTRVLALERHLQRYRWVSLMLVAGIVVAVIFSSSTEARDQATQRTRSLVIEDADGRERILLGAPVVESTGRVSPCNGLRINDATGVERFAACLFDDGRVVVGLDAPVEKGDDRNRERITLVADADGGAYIRFLNRQTGVPGRIVLSADDKMYLEFLQRRDGRTRVKRIGFDGEEIADLNPN